MPLGRPSIMPAPRYVQSPSARSASTAANASSPPSPWIFGVSGCGASSNLQLLLRQHMQHDRQHGTHQDGAMDVGTDLHRLVALPPIMRERAQQRGVLTELDNTEVTGLTVSRLLFGPTAIGPSSL